MTYRSWAMIAARRAAPLGLRCRLGRHDLYPVGHGHSRCLRCHRVYIHQITITGRHWRHHDPRVL